MTHFNPRPLAGATVRAGIGQPVGIISIHAPLRGRPLIFLPYFCRHEISIHAPLRGRQVLVFVCRLVLVFQSTPPCGGDKLRSSDRWCPGHFNPRPLAGATSLRSVPGGSRLFQSTPPCGGDQRFQPPARYPGISIHAPLRGRPRLGQQGRVGVTISIHAPLRGRQ